MLARLLRVSAFRYTAFYTLVLFASLLALFLTIYWSVSKTMQDHIAKGIETQMTALSIAHGAGAFPELVMAVNRLTSTSGGERIYLLLDDKGRKVAGNIDRISPRNGWMHLVLPVNESGSALKDIEDADAAVHDVIALGETRADGAFLLVGDDTEQVSDAEEATIDAFLWALVPTLAFGSFGGAFLSINYLRRIDSITQTSKEIINGDLGRRIELRGSHDEMDRLSANLNDMFERIQSLMESLRHVSADIAHDLRTPLSNLRQRLEKVRENPRAVDVLENAIDDALVQVDDILGTFAALIRIAQIESRTRTSGFDRCSLSEIFTHVANIYAATIAEKEQVLSTRIDEDIFFIGDRSLLTQMLSNLIENAHQHSPRGAHIAVSLQSVGPDAVGDVSDSGLGIPMSEHEHVLKRFYRLDRSLSSPGNGLGLALVAAVADLHGIKLSLEDAKPGLRVRVRFLKVATSMSN